MFNQEGWIKNICWEDRAWRIRLIREYYYTEGDKDEKTIRFDFDILIGFFLCFIDGLRD